MDLAIEIALGAGALILGFLAQMYRTQRDDLAHAWLHFHPEDFPDLSEEKDERE